MTKAQKAGRSRKPVVLLALVAMVVPATTLAAKPDKFTATCDVRWVDSAGDKDPGGYDATVTATWTGGDPYQVQFAGDTEPRLLDETEKAANGVQTTYRDIPADVTVQADFFGHSGKTIGMATAACVYPV